MSLRPPRPSRSDSTAEADVAAGESTTSTPSAPMLLLVEHDRDLAELFAHLAQRAGWQIILAPDIASAREFVRVAPPLAALVVEQIAVEVHGAELFDYARSVHAGITCAVVVDFDRRSRESHLRGSGVTLLPKPVEPEALLALLRRARP